MSEHRKCWACQRSNNSFTPDPPRLYEAAMRVVEGAGFVMCDACYSALIGFGLELPGLSEYGRVLLVPGNNIPGMLPTAWIFRLAVPDAVNGELLYRMAAPRQQVVWALSVPGWLFVVTHE